VQDVRNEFQRMPRIKKHMNNSTGVESAGPRDSLQERRRIKASLNAKATTVSANGVHEIATPSDENQLANQHKQRKYKRTAQKQVDQSPSPQPDWNERRKRLVAEQHVQSSDSDPDTIKTIAERVQPRKHWKSIFHQV